LRALDLREAALDRLGRAWLPEAAPWAVPRRHARAIRLVTYNVHYCKGLDGKLSPARIARVIAQCEPDVVALQELDVGRPRTGDLDQAQAVARALDMDFHFHPTWRLAEELQGDAVLSRVPMKLIRAAALTEGNRRLRLKSRGALWVELDLDGLSVQLVNTHLDVAPGAALAQIEELLGPEWLGHPECKAPVVLCGDFNSTPRTRVYGRAAARLRDAQVSMNGHRPRATWFGSRPMRRIDHVFISHDFEVERVEVPNTTLTHVASDHLPLVVELRLS
jgi:endonuclease/exonuclease/phosphatase family metal-dependent hydrolase